MSKSGFEDEVLIKLIVGVLKHVTIDELGPVDYRGSYYNIITVLVVVGLTAKKIKIILTLKKITTTTETL
jgi:hypothetical protein